MHSFLKRGSGQAPRSSTSLRPKIRQPGSENPGSSVNWDLAAEPSIPPPESLEDSYAQGDYPNQQDVGTKAYCRPVSRTFRWPMSARLVANYGTRAGSRRTVRYRPTA